MPLQGRKIADYAAMAAFAAGRQGKFWEFHDQIFLIEQLTEESVDSIAQKLGLNMVQYKADQASKEIQDHMNKDAQDSQKAGVRGTPTVYINGQKLKNRSPRGFQDLIDKELAKKQ